jgi:hypothetical protein
MHTSPIVKHIELKKGESLMNINFTNKLKGHTGPHPGATTFIISGYTINDVDGKGIADWNITITNETITRTVRTDQNGSYKFTGLANGSYTVT